MLLQTPRATRFASAYRILPTSIFNKAKRAFLARAAAISFICLPRFIRRESSCEQIRKFKFFLFFFFFSFMRRFVNNDEFITKRTSFPRTIYSPASIHPRRESSTAVSRFENLNPFFFLWRFVNDDEFTYDGHCLSRIVFTRSWKLFNGDYWRANFIPSICSSNRRG